MGYSGVFILKEKIPVCILHTGIGIAKYGNE